MSQPINVDKVLNITVTSFIAYTDGKVSQEHHVPFAIETLEYEGEPTLCIYVKKSGSYQGHLAFVPPDAKQEKIDSLLRESTVEDDEDCCPYPCPACQTVAATPQEE